MLGEEIESIMLWVAGVSVFLAVCISVRMISLHQINFTQADTQSKIVGILWMVPIYAVCSFLCLLIPEFALYIDLMRDCYEAYVLYLFLALMLAYMNGNSSANEYQVIEYMETIDTVNPPCPFRICLKSPLPKGEQFLRLCKLGVLQYCVVKPVVATTAIILDVCGWYGESEFKLDEGFLYCTLLANMSVAFAFYILAQFYYSMKKFLHRYDPVPKFLCIKAVIFFAFWQGVLIAIAVKTKLITDIGPYSAARLSSVLRNFLSCTEMFFFSLVYSHAFSYKPFVGHITPYDDRDRDRDLYVALEGALPEVDLAPGMKESGSVGRAKDGCRSLSSLLKLGGKRGLSLSLGLRTDLDHHFSHKTALRHFNDSMPVVLPTQFEAKRGLSIPSNPEDRVSGVARAEVSICRSQNFADTVADLSLPISGSSQRGSCLSGSTVSTAASSASSTMTYLSPLIETENLGKDPTARTGHHMSSMAIDKKNKQDGEGRNSCRKDENKDKATTVTVICAPPQPMFTMDDAFDF